MKKKQFASSVIRKSFLKKTLINFTCLVQIFCLLAVSTPAAAQTLAGGAGRLAQEARYQYLSANFAAFLPDRLTNLFKSGKPVAKKQTLSQIHIFPGDVTIRQGEQIAFSAIGVDAEGQAISGVEFEWTAVGMENSSGQFSIERGRFEPWVAGAYTVMVTGNGQQAQAAVTVERPEPVSAEQNRRGAGPIAVSMRSLSGKTKKSPPSEVEENLKESGQSEEDSLRSIDDPDNLPGNPPGHPADGGATSGNFQLSAPVIALPGRGVDLALNLNYNSRVWHKSGSTLTYDYDGGFPAPGWSLGFGKIKDMGANSGSLVIDADGTRHPYAGVITDSGVTFNGYTTDGKFIDYKSWRNSSGVYSAKAWLPDGTYIEYGAKAAGAVYPIRIRDAQGNYITVTYRNNQGPAIETVTDTLGRVVTFNYDSSVPARLLSVTAPRMQNEDPVYGTGATRTLLRLHYQPLTLNYSFSGLTPVVANGTPQVLDAIYYPGTGTGFWFGDPDSYSSYGMLTKVQENRGMTWASGSTEQGDVTAGQTSKQAVYNYPLTTVNASGRTNGVGLSDAPNYTTLSESWAERDVAQDAVTTFGFNNNTTKWDGTSVSPARMVSVTQPNGTISRQYSYRTPGAWTDGLVFYDETIVMDGTTEVVVSSSLVSWQPGDYQSPRPSWAQLTDERGKKVKTTYDYGSGIFNQMLRSCDYDDANVKLRCTNAIYENSQAYKGTWLSLNTGTETLWIFSSGRHIFNLVTMTNIENPDGSIASQTNYEYDNYQTTPLMNTPGVISHEASHDPHTTQTTQQQGPCINWYQPPYGSAVCTQYQINTVSVYDSATAKRGNVTKVTSYSDAGNPGGPTGAVDEVKSYDITGNLRTASTSCCQQTALSYEISNQFAYPVSRTRGAADPNSPHRITTSSTYDFSTGLPKQQTDANGRSVLLMYHPNTLRPVKSILPTGAYSAFGYDDTAMTVSEEVRDASGNLGGQSLKYLNGLGMTRREESLGATNVWDIVETKYTKEGEEWKKSRPHRLNETPQWIEKFYDAQGRLTKITEPDGSETNAVYNSAQFPDSATVLSGNVLPPGNTLLVVDQWGRQRWGRYDQQGRLAEIAEPNPDRTTNPDGRVLPTFNGPGAGSLLTKYSYDTLGNLVKIDQGGQLREWKYDSLGRVTRQKMSEQTATLNDAGIYVGAGNAGAQWSEAFWYDSRSNLTQKTDPRGVKTLLSHQIGGGEDPLNRLHTKTYDLSGPLDPNLPIHAAATVTYSYMATGDKTRLSQIRTAGILTEDFTYDTEGRIRDYTQTIDYRGSYPMTTSYFYDSLNRIDEVWYPAQYGLGSNARRIIKSSYDVASRLTNLKVDGTEVAGNIVYNADDQTSSIKIGPSSVNQITENYAFDPQTGLLTSQNLEQGNQTLLDLNYEYDRTESVGNLNGKTGQITKIINNLSKGKSRMYEYDALGRLVKAKGGGSTDLWEQNYTYDRYGNRTNVTASGVAANNSPIPVDGTPNLAYSTASNRITTTNYEYDSAGNQTRSKAEDGTWLKYEYDAANRVQVVKRDDGTPLQAFQYGSNNVRLMDLDYQYGYTKMIATDGNGVNVSEYTEFASTVMTWTKSNIYLGRSQLSTISRSGSSEVTEYHHPDQLGTRVITDQAAGTNSHQVTLPFGTALNAESTVFNNPRRFTSYERSAPTGLDYAINRTYDSKLGRFTQVDPIRMQSASLLNPQTLNLYSYCANDPVNRTDANGLFFGSLFKWIGKAFKLFNKILKWVVIAVAVVAVAIAVFHSGGAALAFLKMMMGIVGKLLGVSIKTSPIIINFAAGTITGGTVSAISIGLSGQIIAGLYAVGAVASGFGNDPPRQEEIDRMAKNALDNIYRVMKNFPNLLDIIRQNGRGKLADEVWICHAAMESSLHTDAVGFEGEIGLFQVKPSTAKPLAPLANNGKAMTTRQVRKKLFDPAFNTQIGTTYLEQLYGQFGSDLTKALGAYKQGAASVTRDGLSQASQEYAAAINKCADTLINSR